MHLSESQIKANLKKASKLVEVGGLYTHYKNPEKKYKVLHLAMMEADDSMAVIYQAQYGTRLIFVRSLERWTDTIEWNGERVKRFTYLS